LRHGSSRERDDAGKGCPNKVIEQRRREARKIQGRLRTISLSHKRPILRRQEPPELQVAIYARVSTDDKGQDPENQLRQLRAWCASAGYQIAREYVDHASGAKGVGKRPEFAAMLADAHKRQFDLVLCWALDRLSR
jgi:predicted site-specific integrase-resolvase